jgi:signal transduction histidine kinase
MDLYILLFYALVPILILVSLILYFKINKLRKINVGLMHVIEKSEEKYLSGDKPESRLVSMVAHQLKSPLAAIKLSLKMLIDQDFGSITKEQQDILEKTYKKNDSLIFLVNNLLQQAMDNEKGNNKNAKISLTDSTLQVIDSYSDEIKRKKIKFVFNNPGQELPEIIADPEKIFIVIQNLLDNAVKYTPENGKIEIEISLKGKNVQFKIKDSGIGIPDSQKDRIFTRFFRASNVFNVKETGSGLGLSIVKEVIDDYGGRVWLESNSGKKGTTFLFTLPIAHN